MIAGDPATKKNNRVSICHRCLGNGEGFAPCDAKDTGELPNKYCPNGIRATIIFPSCWDGKNVDSPDHKSHVAYSNSGGLGSTNVCIISLCPHFWFPVLSWNKFHLYSMLLAPTSRRKCQLICRSAQVPTQWLFHRLCMRLCGTRGDIKMMHIMEQISSLLFIVLAMRKCLPCIKLS